MLVEETEGIVNAHAIAHQAKAKIEGEIEGVDEALAHVEPHEIPVKTP